MNSAGIRRYGASFWIRAALLGLLLLEFVSAEAGILSHRRFSQGNGSPWLVAIFVGAIFVGGCVAVVRLKRGTSQPFVVTALTAVTLLSIRLQLPVILDWYYHGRVLRTASRQSPGGVRFLRELSAAEEQYRLVHGSYASDMDSLHVLPPPRTSRVALRTNGDAGWSGLIVDSRVTCSIWVRDTLLRRNTLQPEGSPTCSSGENRLKNQTINSIVAPLDVPRTRFRDADATGDWLQHRADPNRSGHVKSAAPPNAGFRWTMRLGGELRSSVAIAGNQVFVGAHGNGEFAGLTLDSGLMGFRVRAPNWIHHEPAVAGRLVIVGFGNNERSDEGLTAFGSSPSGVVAYDRRTGLERWRKLTRGSVMTTPVIWRDFSIAAPTSREMFAWRLADGKEMWHTQLPSATAMGNPLLFDSLIVVGIEPTSVCVLNASSGKIIFCHSFALPRRGVWGAGHASAAATNTSIFQVFVEGTRLKSVVGVFATVMKALGMPDQFWDLEASQPMEQILVSLAWDGSERWRTRLGPGRNPPAGHVAGTPTLENGVVYVPSPLNGRVIALDEDRGNILWSTEVKTARGAVSLSGPSVFAATTDGLFVILDRATGQVRCRERLPAVSDRAGLTISGNTGILTLRNGMVMARPMADWLSCAA